MNIAIKLLITLVIFFIGSGAIRVNFGRTWMYLFAVTFILVVIYLIIKALKE